ncbi:MAG: helix-turn-helix transcriptional regulator [Nanoarchaeota archaeon]
MEETCSICGISGKMRNVFEVISPKGVVLACEKCISEEGFPILKRPDKRVFDESDRKSRVSDVMERLTGVKPKERERREFGGKEKTLREIVDKRHEEKTKVQGLNLKPRPDLVDNFHWIIMRVRRLRGITQGQLAEAIGEAESAVKMAEQGVVPPGYGLVDKLERFLRVKLIRERNFHDPLFAMTQFLEKSKSQEKNPRIFSQSQPKIFSQPQQKKAISFDRQILDSLTISDLKRIKMEKERENIKLMEDEYAKEKAFGKPETREAELDEEEP